MLLSLQGGTLLVDSFVTLLYLFLFRVVLGLYYANG